MTRLYNTYKRKRIEYEDDIVIVFVDDRQTYKGIEDYEPMKDENWKWDSSIQAYTLDDPRTNGQTYIKICLDV